MRFNVYYYPPPKRRADPQWQTRVVQLIRELESSRKQIGEILSDPHASKYLGGGVCIGASKGNRLMGSTSTVQGCYQH